MNIKKWKPQTQSGHNQECSLVILLISKIIYFLIQSQFWSVEIELKKNTNLNKYNVISFFLNIHLFFLYYF